jgi:hypothetical protein
MTRPLNRAKVMKTLPVSVDSVDQLVAVEFERVNFTFVLVLFFVFGAFVRLGDIFPIIGSLHPILVLRIGTPIGYTSRVIRGHAGLRWWAGHWIPRCRIQASPVDVPVPNWSFAQHPTKQAFLWA